MSDPQTTKILTKEEHEIACEKQLKRLGYKDIPQTTYARPEGTRERLHEVTLLLRALVTDIEMPGDFAVKARNLCVDMDNERNRREQD